MIESIGIVDGETLLRTFAGGSAVVGLGALVVSYVGGQSRPCWTGTTCLLKAADPTTCARCSVYQHTRGTGLRLRDLPALGEVPRFGAAGARD